MGRAAGRLFFKLLDEFMALRARRQIFVELFGTSAERIEILDRVSGNLFQVFHDDLFEMTLLHLSRMTDRVRTVSKPNLTLSALAEAAGPQHCQALSEAAEKARNKCEFARDWRNRRLAHRDQLLSLDARRRPRTASRRLVNEAVAEIEAVLNLASVLMLDETLSLEPIGLVGQPARDLLHILDPGLFKRERANRESP